MSNYPSIIARPVPGGFEGRYVNNDGHPAARIPLLRALYGAFRGDLDAMHAFLIDAHPAGWSRLGTDPHGDTGWSGVLGLPAGAPLETFVCYCHGDRNENPLLLTHRNAAAASDAERVYILTADGIQVLTLDEDSYDETSDPCGERMTWSAPQLADWASERLAAR